ncbi:MAG: SRPBCC domain-containing protein, partial [Acidobacteriota bacterium]
FVFDLRHRMVDWSRRRALSRKRGTVPFDSIRAVVAQTPIGDHGIPSRRIALLTHEGELPLSVAYSPDNGNECLRIAAELNRAIGRPTDDPLSHSLRGAVEAGRSLEAIRLLRQERPMSLGAAYGEIEKLKTGPASTSTTATSPRPAPLLPRPPLRIVERSTINRPSESVWPYVILSEYFRRWNKKIVSMDAPDEFKVGQSFTTRYRMGSKEIQCLTTVAVVEENRLLEMRHANCMGESIGPDLEVVETITLQEKRGRTHVRKVVTVRNHSLPWLLIPIIWFVSRFGSPTEPNALKALCEGDG